MEYCEPTVNEVEVDQGTLVVTPTCNGFCVACYSKDGDSNACYSGFCTMNYCKGATRC